jgi:hypothetical protein
MGRSNRRGQHFYASNSLDASTGAAEMNQITESDLFSIGMESRTAWELMPQLCEALGIEYPPKLEPQPKREIPDPLAIH